MSETTTTWLSPKQASEYLNLNVHTVYTFLQRGEIRGVHRGRRWYIKPEWLDAWVMEGAA